MDFALSEHQDMLRSGARDFLSKECPKSLVREMDEDERNYSRELWAKMAELGWMGLLIPEEYGGSGGSFLDMMILLEETGMACVPVPFFSTVILGAMPIMIAGSKEQKGEYLPQIARGQLVTTLALTEPSAKLDARSIEVTATKKEGKYLIEGIKLFVPDAHVSDYMVCVAKTNATEDGIALFIVDSKDKQIEYSLLPTIGCDKLCEVTFSKATVPQSNILGEGWELVEKILRYAALAKCAEMIGTSRRVLEMTVDYAKERVQFGRPIGSFQSIQHHCANMLIEFSPAEVLTYQAAWMMSQGLPCATEVAMAKALVGDACTRVCELGHQVHGGVGLTMEHDMQRYYRRVKAAELSWGDSSYHREMIAQHMDLIAE
ncbi:acyl-CoA dehydrogenase family protein [Chloroflexota bacterium]